MYRVCRSYVNSARPMTAADDQREAEHSEHEHAIRRCSAHLN